MKMFRLYIGSAHKYFHEFGGNMETVVHQCLTRAGIEGYTIHEVRGVWNGETERSLVVEVVGVFDFKDLEDVAIEILNATGEESVLVLELTIPNTSKFVTIEGYQEYECDEECSSIPNSLKF